jgi:hypothetical protein
MIFYNLENAYFLVIIGKVTHTNGVIKMSFLTHFSPLFSLYY